MSREVKFRFWNSTVSQMFPVTTEMKFKKNGKPDIGTAEILMQYTGLKDKNGKEIYEGDIVKTIATLPKEVKFISSNGMSQHHGFNIRYSESLEVIGNIYENPEKKEK